MFIELNVWLKQSGAFRQTSINVQQIDDFFPDSITIKNEIDIMVGTRIYMMNESSYFVKQTYQEVRNLLANVSLLVNE